MNDASSDAPDDAAAVEAAVAAARTALRSAVAALANGVVREGQDDMCAAVASAFVRREHLLVQAGTGTGKSLAYLVPSVLADGRVVIVTATKALQEQLCSKDLPLLRSTLQRPFEFAALKGRSNYVCLARKQEVDADRAATLAGMRDDDDVLDEVDEWVASTGSGDRADLPVAVSESLWSALSIDSQECPGRAKCAFGETCFAERARDRAAEADVIVVNTALYAQHLDAGGGVLPPHDWVVVDEAHSLEDIAADAFGVALGSTRLGRLASLVRTVLTGDGGGDADLVVALQERARRWNELLTACPADQRIDLDAQSLRPALVVVESLLGDLGSTLARLPSDDPESSTRIARVQRFVSSTRDDVQYMLGANPSRDAIWVEGRDSPSLVVTRIDVGPTLAARLFAQRTVVLASATLAVGDDFGPVAWRLGLRPEAFTSAMAGEDEIAPEHPERYTALDVGSPFDYRKQAILYCASHLPDPRSDDFADAWIDEAVELVAAAGGRTLGLCTSLRAATTLRDALRERLPDIPVLSPDELPRRRLMEEFARVEHSCLVGSLGLWQGIDVPGPAVSLVIVDKIPFARPTDPLAMARREQAEAAGHNAFATYDLPRAALLLAQGVGRLVRAQEDRGVVAVLDRRLVASGYGRRLVDSLPPMYRMTDPDRVRAALQRLAAGSP